MEDAGEAVYLLSRARSSQINAEMEQQSIAGILDMVFVSVLQMANRALALHEAVSRSGDLLAHSQERVKKYKGQCQGLAEKLARQQEEAKAREEDLGGMLKEAESRVEIEDNRASVAKTKLALVSAKLESAGTRIEELIRQLQHAEGWANAAADETHAAVERAAAVEMAAVEVGYGQAEALAHTQEARARAEEAESRAWKAGAQAREAEVQAREAEARADNVVTNFKASSEFEQEVIEASIDTYAKGFDLCKAKMSEAFNINSSDLEKIQPGDLDGEESEEEEVAGEEPRPSGP